MLCDLNLPADMKRGRCRNPKLTKDRVHSFEFQCYPRFSIALRFRAITIRDVVDCIDFYIWAPNVVILPGIVSQLSPCRTSLWWPANSWPLKISWRPWSWSVLSHGHGHIFSRNRRFKNFSVSPFPVASHSASVGRHAPLRRRKCWSGV